MTPHQSREPSSDRVGARGEPGPATDRRVVLLLAGIEPFAAPPAELAAALGLTAADHRTPPAAADDLVLWLGDGAPGLGFHRDGSERAHRLDFDRDAPTDRAATALLCRALGIGRGVHRVIDATAGFGRDALALAVAGADVTMIERQPILAALLRDALARATHRFSLRLFVADARVHLASLAASLADDPATAPDAIYLDPMYPETGKSALPRGPAQLLRALMQVEPNADAANNDRELLALARSIARRRVVVKRPPRAPALVDDKTIAVLRGSRARYDIYAPTPRSGVGPT